jgi:hypothetical protein
MDLLGVVSSQGRIFTLKVVGGPTVEAKPVCYIFIILALVLSLLGL